MNRDRIINIVGLTGFGLITIGLWMLSPAVALIVTGSLMLGVAAYAARMKEVPPDVPRGNRNL